MAYARARYGSTSRIGVASPSCCEDCKCGAYCDGCPDSVRRGATLPNRYLSLRGADAESAQGVFGDLKESLTSPSIKTAAGIALTYHGYKRTGSVLWALAYGAIGRLSPLIGVPVALAQGFGQKKVGC